MILVERGLEPDSLHKIRLNELTRLAAIARKAPPTADDIGTRYKVVAGDLWRAHREKCCYCENKIQRGYNDVEHYRPKAEAIRRPGSTETHGYWWLAFTWANLLSACPTCNRSNKRTLFPLDMGSVALAPRRPPPGKEVPLLIDPSRVNGVEHIEFVFSTIQPVPSAGDHLPDWPLRKHWWPRARGGSRIGEHTIIACGLDKSDLVELYDHHVADYVRPAADDLQEQIMCKGDVHAAFARANRLLNPRMPFVGLSYDSLRSLIPAAWLSPWKLAWPLPREVGTPLIRRRTC